MDLYPDGTFRGWADRLAARLAQDEPDLLYANLAVRGKLARQVEEEQLEPALALQPDLASVLSGLNDMLRRNCSVLSVIERLDTIIGSLREAGADVLAFTLPDPVPINPIAKGAALRLRNLNLAVRDLAVKHGAYLVDLEAHAGLVRPPPVAPRPAARERARARADRRSPPPRRSDCQAPTRAGRHRSPTRSTPARACRTRCGRASTSRPGWCGGCAASRPATASPRNARISSRSNDGRSRARPCPRCGGSPPSGAAGRGRSRRPARGWRA